MCKMHVVILSFGHVCLLKVSEITKLVGAMHAINPVDDAILHKINCLLC
jgi:hypothetical protein